MIKNLRDNRTLLGLLFLLALYILVGLIAPRPYVFRVVAILQTIAGLYAVIIYSDEAWKVLWNRRRAEYGAHLKIVGVWLLGLAALYSGLWRALWVSLHEPQSWQQTWHSSFGWVLVIAGMFFVTISPAEIDQGTTLPKFFWFMFGGALLFVSGVVTGSFLL